MISQALREQQRVQRHIAKAEQIAQARATEPLTPLQQLVRSLLLEALSEYREAGIFPQNPQLGTQLPFFIDAHGTRCAMAHLLELGGEHELVARIANERNNAWIHELADEPRLLAWLNAAGLTVEEAAAIQPSYCGPEYQCGCNPVANNQRVTPIRDIFIARVTQDAGAQGTLQAEVVQTFGVDGGLAVGDPVVMKVSEYAWPEGDRATHFLTMFPAAGLNGLPGVAAGFPLDEGGQWRCHFYSRLSWPVDPALAARALLSDNCPATYLAANRAWANNPCATMDAGLPDADAASIASLDATADSGSQFDARVSLPATDGSMTAHLDASTTADTGSQLTPPMDPPGVVMRCSALPPGSTDPTSLGILLSIASAMLARRRQLKARVSARS